ncbi:MAG: ABC transporter permease [Bacteroidales bacterium]
MIKIVLRNCLRSLVNQMPYSFVNILGLTIGVASALLLIIWISVETSYENFHKDRDRLYRVGMIMKTPNKEINSAAINAPAGPEFKKEFPVVENMVRFELDEKSVIYNEKTIKLKVLYTDSTFLEMFSFVLATGNRQNCLDSPQGIVLTEKTVKRIFGSADPLGKGILIDGETFTITAIIKDPPVNTSMQFDCLAPLTVIARKMHIGWDGGLSCYTYLKLVKGADPAALENKILEYMEGAINKRYRAFGYALNPYLQKISDIHLKSEADYELGEKGSLKQVILFSGIGLLILFIACFNFVNISTALSFKRAKEVSIKKIYGSGRKNIILFFVLESAIAILISLVLALLLAKIMLPVASGLIGEGLSLKVIKPLSWLLIFTSIFIFCTLFASFYSSVYLSSINPLALLSDVNSGKRKQYSRNILVTFQYAISIALIISCLVIFLQMQFVKKSDKGFNEKNILLIDLNSKTAARYELILSRFSSIPGVGSVSVSAGGEPGVGFFMNGYLPEGFEKPMLARALYVDENYLKTMGISLIDGRDFRNISSDSNKAIINQTFARILGWDQPTGKSISRNGRKYEVIGMAKDFNTSSLYNKTEPIFISTVNEVGEFEKVVLKYTSSNLSDVLQACKAVYKEIDPNYPFEYEFLEDLMATSYSKDQKMNLLFLVLSAIAIFISSLGLFGLTTFATQSRIREISIRKINGATISDIMLKFNFELLKWILVSFVIAAPIGYYAMGKWLNNFAYKTTISLWLLLASGLLALTIAMLTVSWAALKAARANPAEVLRKD